MIVQSASVGETAEVPNPVALELVDFLNDSWTHYHAVGVFKNLYHIHENRIPLGFMNQFVWKQHICRSMSSHKATMTPGTSPYSSS